MTREQQVELLEKIKSAGVVGAGGAGFPTHTKLLATAEYLVINGAECEPLLQTDQRLMQLKASELLYALEVLIDAIGVTKAIIAVKMKYEQAWQSLLQFKKDPRIELFPLQDFYPAGDEQVLVYEVLGRIVPQGGIPIKVGCIVTNVETLLNVSAAIDGYPVLDKYVCITGAVSTPLTAKLPLGTTIRDAVSLSQPYVTDTLQVIEGGPVMGKIVTDLDAPITKTTKGLIVLSQEHVLVSQKQLPLSRILKRAQSVCVQCMRCTDLCPRALLGHDIKPHKIMRSISYGISDTEVLSGSLLCSECGVCEFACLMQLSPRKVNSILKVKLGKAGIKASIKGAGPVAPEREFRKLSSDRLIASIGLSQFHYAAPIQDVQFEPQKVIIPLKQHLGAPSYPVVKVGQKVQRGDLLGEIPEEALGARIHASISGTVTDIADRITILSD
ncbi:MAG: 4Fe-4S dicluster domain-containing protein [Clostridiales bacterium]|jgi:Na+-translocating ferredoxin:NAD+ oxidoreductase RnfC subunit|nr:4Fe-4S dicluster domain-containing protein [Clostridiales bacterium]